PSPARARPALLSSSSRSGALTLSGGAVRSLSCPLWGPGIRSTELPSPPGLPIHGSPEKTTVAEAAGLLARLSSAALGSSPQGEAQRVDDHLQRPRAQT